MDVASLLDAAPPVAQGGLLLVLLGGLLRVMWVERRDYRGALERYETRLRELEAEHRARVRELEAEVDAERDRRRAAEDGHPHLRPVREAEE